MEVSADRRRDFLAGVDSIPSLVTAAGENFGRQRHRLRQASFTIGDLDLFIAATCLQHNLTLLTNNRRHFGFPSAPWPAQTRQVSHTAAH